MNMERYNPPRGVALNADSLLVCPKCAGTYLHHAAATLWQRDAEDQDATQIKVSPRGVQVGRLANREVPGRRDGLQLYFTCETCGPVGHLRILQRKGQTLFEWTGVKDA